jgi:hypothetical protein
VHEVFVEILEVATAARIEIATYSEVHMRCQVGCAIEASHGDNKNAPATIKEAATCMAGALRAGKPSWL